MVTSETPPERLALPKTLRTLRGDPEYQPISGPLHHYTSLDALVSIVKSKSLRATNVHYMNDASESELGLKTMKEVAEQVRKGAEGVDREFLDFFLDWLGRRVFESASVYVLCFSQAHNQLSQWRGYTAHGRGVCLSIDAGLLVQRMQAYGWTFQNCRYNRESQLTWADAILSRMRREAAADAPALAADKERHFNVVLSRALSDLLQVAATIKHDAFTEEREVRFISSMIPAGDARVLFRVGRTALIPYVEFQLAESADHPLTVAEIMIGPSPTQNLTHAAVVGLVRQNGFKGQTTISASQIPYREL